MTNHTIPHLPEIDNVEIRHIPDFPGYAVSDDGRVWSCKMSGSCRKFEHWKELRLHIAGNRSSYKFAVLNRNSRPYNRNVHVLVLNTFVGPRPNGMQACHNNGNSFDNSLSNLRWDTPKSNWADRRKHGRSSAGEGNGQAKANRVAIEEIRRLAASGVSRRKLKEQFLLSKAQVRRIIVYESWRETPLVIP